MVRIVMGSVTMSGVYVSFSHRESLHAVTMPRGVSIPESTCWVVVRMHTCYFSPEQIRLLTDVSPCQQRRILKCLHETNHVLPEKNDPRIFGGGHAR